MKLGPRLNLVESEVALAKVVLALGHQPHRRVDVLVHGRAVDDAVDEGKDLVDLRPHNDPMKSAVKSRRQEVTGRGTSQADSCARSDPSRVRTFAALDRSLG